MPFAEAGAAQAPQTPRELRSIALLLFRAAFTLWLVTFLVGGPVSSVQTSTSEIGRQDSVSVGTATPSTWFRRCTSSVDESVGLAFEFGPMSEELVLPDARVGEITIQPAVQSVVALTTQRRYAAPVRGPPCVQV
jgi:hypothetical protein